MLLSKQANFGNSAQVYDLARDHGVDVMSIDKVQLAIEAATVFWINVYVYVYICIPVSVFEYVQYTNIES